MEASVTLNLDASPFRQELGNTEQVVNNGAARMQSRFASIFKRSPNMRAERALQGLFQSLAQGDIAGGIESIAHRMTGLGLAAAIGIGAGVAIFVKFKEQIDATRKAHEVLQAEIRKPLSIVTSLSSEGMEQALQSRKKLEEDLTEKSGKRFGSEIKEAFQSIVAADLPGSDANPGDASGRRRLGIEQDLNKSIAQRKEIMMAQSDLAVSLLGIRRQELGGDERQAHIAKIVLETEQARAALKEKGLTRKAFDKADEALSENAELMIKAENKRVAAKERNLAIEEKMAGLINKGLKPEDQKKVREGLELQDINKQLSNPATNSEERRNLLLQKTQKENELRGFAKPEEGQNPYQFGTLSGRDFERNQDSAKFNSQFSGFGMSQEQKDLKGPANPNAEVVTAVNQVTEAIKNLVADMNK